MDYGKCERCEGKLIGIRFIEEELDEHMISTGRKRMAVSHLECENCMKKVIVDDSFDGPWK